MTNIACCDEYIPEATLVSQMGTIDDVFDVGERLGVGVGDTRTVMLLAEGYHFFW